LREERYEVSTGGNQRYEVKERNEISSSKARGLRNSTGKERNDDARAKREEAEVSLDCIGEEAED